MAKKRFEGLFKKTSLHPKYFNDFVKYSEQIENLGTVYDQKIKDEKFELGLLSSDDLELFTADILRTEPDLAKAFASHWDYWLVDEYQDTSPLQVEIMSQLRGDSPVYMVGDPQQSIYLFRGARVEVFDKESKRIIKAGGQSSELTKNYRSKPELLAAINDLIKDLGPSFEQMHPRLDEFNPEVEALRIVQTTKEDEYNYQGIIKFITDKLNSGAELGDFCVLGKTNNLLLKVASELESAGLFCSVHSASGYYSRREIIDLISLLKFLVNPHDNMNLIRLLKSPWFRVEDSLLSQLKKTTLCFYVDFAQAI